ncbi:MAG TPA: hypothetical protein VN968_25410 [Bradyrhizobium sp.]|nr:hypothetical protein [Bradyrhizobium sp.]
MGTSRPVPVDRKISALAVGLLLLSALPLGGCATSIAEMPIVGTPADAPARPKEAGTYLPVHDLPPDREEAEMTPAEQAKALKELAAARDHQASVAAKNPAAK